MRQQQAYDLEWDRSLRLMFEKLDPEEIGFAYQTDIVKMLVAIKMGTIRVLFYTKVDEEETEEYESRAENPSITLENVILEGMPIEDFQLDLQAVVKQFKSVNLEELQQINLLYGAYLKKMDREFYVTSIEPEHHNPDESLFSPTYTCTLPSNNPEDGANDSDLVVVSDPSAHTLYLSNLATRSLQVWIGSEAGDKDGPFDTATFNAPAGLVAEPTSQLVYVADTGNGRIRVCDMKEHVVRTLYPQVPPIIQKEIIDKPLGLALDATQGRLFVTSDHRIQVLDLRTGQISPVAGDEYSDGCQDGPAATSLFSSPRGCVYLPETERLLVADAWNHRLRQVELSTGLVSTVAGDGKSGFLDGPGHVARFNMPTGLAYDGRHSVLVTDLSNKVIRCWDITLQSVRTVAGSGLAGWVDGFAPAAKFAAPQDVAFLRTGGFVAVDSENSLLRLAIRPKRPLAQAPRRHSLCMGGFGTAYASDRERHSIVKCATQVGGVVEWVAGTGQPGFRDGPVAEAEFDSPDSLAMDRDGNLYVADFGNHRIRLIRMSDSTVSTVAGSGWAGDSEGPALEAHLDSPHSIQYVKEEHALLFACWGSLKKLQIERGQIVTLQGAYGHPTGLFEET
jgi:DNA-binding beta-propeller fold protein YncE